MPSATYGKKKKTLGKVTVLLPNKPRKGNTTYENRSFFCARNTSETLAAQILPIAIGTVDNATTVCTPEASTSTVRKLVHSAVMEILCICAGAINTRMSLQKASPLFQRVLMLFYITPLSVSPLYRGGIGRVQTSWGLQTRYHLGEAKIRTFSFISPLHIAVLTLFWKPPKRTS